MSSRNVLPPSSGQRNKHVVGNYGTGIRRVALSKPVEVKRRMNESEADVTIC
jgi:hypothetical protein